MTGLLTLSISVVPRMIYQTGRGTNVGIHDLGLVDVSKNIAVLDEATKYHFIFFNPLFRVFQTIKQIHTYGSTDREHLVNRITALNFAPKFGKIIWPRFGRGGNVVTAKPVKDDRGRTVPIIPNGEIAKRTLFLNEFNINLRSLSTLQGIGVMHRRFRTSFGSPSGSNSNWQPPAHVLRFQGIRLKHALELVSHFTRLEQEAAESDEMAEEEALMLLKTCISSILSKPTFETAIRFADFRKALGKRTLKDDDGDVVAIVDSPYFFIRTTLSILLSLVKGAKGATQEHAVGNVSTLVPILWPKLREPEKWQIGQAYAEVNADGNREASAGLKRALLKVQGFDFVPESLRSNTFTETAARVLAAHFGFNNFYKEQEPMAILASLGTAIPRPAFAKCMEATLAVWLGNPWGYSYAAVSLSLKIFESLRSEQWEYYFNECLRRDRTILDKMHDDRPMGRWIDLARQFAFDELSLRKSVTIRRFVEGSVEGNGVEIRRLATKLRESATE